MKIKLLCCLSFPLLVACGPANVSGSTQISIQMPAGIVECNNTIPDLRAELWVSGMTEPCELKVASSQTVSGECKVTARIDRTATLDYFYIDAAHGDFRLLLAQATKKLALANPESDRLEVKFAERDFAALSECRDMTNINDDSGLGEKNVDYPPGTKVPICDLDEDFVSNLQEICATPATDPFGG